MDTDKPKARKQSWIQKLKKVNKEFARLGISPEPVKIELPAKKVFL